MQRATLLAMFAVTSMLSAVAGCGKGNKPDPAPGQPATAGGPRVIEPRARISPNFQTKEKLRAFTPSALFLNADGTRAVVSGPGQADRTSQVWALDGEAYKLSEFDGAVMLLLPNGRTALRQVKHGDVSDQIDLATGRVTSSEGVYAGLGSFISDGDKLLSVAVSHVWDRPGPLGLGGYDLKTGQELAGVSIGKDDRARAAPPVKQGRELVYALPRQDLITVWDMAARKPVREFKLTGGKPLDSSIDHTSWNNFRVSQPDGKWIGVSRNFGTPPEVFSGETGALAATLPDHAWVWEFVPGRDLFLTCTYILGGKGIAELAAFDIASKKFVAVFRGNESEIHKVALSGDGKTMITGHQDGSVLVWDLGKLE